VAVKGSIDICVLSVRKIYRAQIQDKRGSPLLSGVQDKLATSNFRVAYSSRTTVTKDAEDSSLTSLNFANTIDVLSKKENFQVKYLTVTRREAD